jgi:hypothetical protein
MYQFKDGKIVLYSGGGSSGGGTGTVTSVRVQAGTGLVSSTSTTQTTSLDTTISIDSGYKLPTTTEWNNKADTGYVVENPPTTSATLTGITINGTSYSVSGGSGGVSINSINVVSSEATNFTGNLLIGSAGTAPTGSSVSGINIKFNSLQLWEEDFDVAFSAGQGGGQWILFYNSNTYKSTYNYSAFKIYIWCPTTGTASYPSSVVNLAGQTVNITGTNNPYTNPYVLELTGNTNIQFYYYGQQGGGGSD